ncbi:unnamed protein product [Arabis nemorensis]|uniref:Uncharacterized protein n=1 Tax=Arabis nemorensis TaxID=586526 RepID=A0A565CQG0_9BRAS|nr:unnamed protein product [Arabis nemorensis]
MLHWVARFQGQVIESFEISIYIPSEFLAEIESLVEFAVEKNVQNLVLDFSHPAWRTYNDASMNGIVVKLPACVYDLATLVSLKIYSCKFDLSEIRKSEDL